MIEETAIPGGYLKTENNDIYFMIENGVVTRTTKDGDVIQPGDVSADITYTKDPDSEHVAEFTVGNHPGSELPKTGGSGTAVYGLIGGLMVVTAGAVLTLRKKKNKA